MTDLEFIAELDKRLEVVKKNMTEEILEVNNDNTLSKKEKKEQIDLICEWYAGITADILILRKDAYEREYLKQDEQYKQEFEKKVPEKTYDYTKIRKNGKWVDRKDN